LIEEATAVNDYEEWSMVSRFSQPRFVMGFLIVLVMWAAGSPISAAPDPDDKLTSEQEQAREFSWEMPGRVSIYDLQFGAAVLKDKKWEFLGNTRSFSAGVFKDRLTLMVRFQYKGSKSDLPIKFIVKVPSARQYEETVHLTNPQGRFTYQFTIHNPENFIGNGSVYLYYGFSMVDVLAFTIMPGS
jgi:hypothetical protein